jgi:DNA-binding NarL/FixJ family response regulator
MDKIRILLADHDAIFRQSIKTLICAELDMELIGEVSNGGDAVEKTAELRPCVVLMDTDMRGLSCFDGTRQIKKHHSKTNVLFLTVSDDLNDLVAGMAMGASGYVLKDSSSAELITAVREVCSGHRYLSPGILAQLVDDFRSRIKSSNRLPRFATMTRRESEILKMIAEGNSPARIARDLNLSISMVGAHKLNLMRKLNIRNGAQLERYAFKNKIKISQIPNFG